MLSVKMRPKPGLESSRFRSASGRAGPGVTLKSIRAVVLKIETNYESD
jgi:hypothetical protein